MALHATETRTGVRPAATDGTGSAHRAWAAGYERVLIDLGTGDGRYAIDLARRCPEAAVIGLDTNLDHLRGSARRRLGNLRFITADALGWEAGLLPEADTVTINFPYGSLLRGVVEGDPGLVARLDALLGRGARIEVRVNASALTATGIEPAGTAGAIAKALRRIDGMRVRARAMTRDELASFPSSWAKRLGYGRETSSWLVVGERR
jgi:16S rRNA (adenine(1408)-N(1))-methyltransferase